MIILKGKLLLILLMSLPLMLVMESCSKGNGSTRNNDKQVFMTLYPNLKTYIDGLAGRYASIPEERKHDLNKLAAWISESIQLHKSAKLIFICTHNSRRSHLSQIWAQTAAWHYNLGDKITTFSGGTEATAFNHRAVAAIERAGFQVVNPKGENPVYIVSFSHQVAGMECYSKKFDDPRMQLKDFAAVMTCSDADAACPSIPGASFRIPIKYEDPKVADGTSEEEKAYDERCIQIATEMFYLMSLVSK